MLLNRTKWASVYMSTKWVFLQVLLSMKNDAQALENYL